MKSRPLQLVILLVLFVLGVVTFNSCRDNGPSSADTPSGEGYIPPSP